VNASPGGSVLAGLRRLGRTRPARAFLTRPRVERVVAVCLQSTVVRGSLRFVARELSGRHRVARYELRASGHTVHLRHNTADPHVLDEVFYSRHYDLPEPVERFLRALGRPPVIVDLGANIGLFGVLMLWRWPDARIIGFEPDHANAEIHRRSLADSGAGTWELVEAAASTAEGHLPFRSGEYSRSRIEESTSTEQVAAVDIFPHLQAADLAKIDIEGGEWPILGDERFASLQTPVLVLEYHPDLCPADDPREAAFAAVQRAGYRTSVTRELGPGQGMLWAWRPEVEELASGRAEPISDRS
jgi:FkbM family methyltransferase